MELLLKLAMWFAAPVSLFLITKLWAWVVHRMFGGPRPRLLAVLIS